MRLRHIKTRGDDGATLVFALILITTTALVSGALLTLNGGRFLATVSLRSVAAVSYAADAAAKTAISDIEWGSKAPGITLPAKLPTPWVYNNGADGTGCFGGTGTVDSSGSAPVTNLNLGATASNPFYSDSQSQIKKDATVVCTPVPGTGIFALGSSAGGTTGGAGGSGGAGNGRALTILGPSADGGLTVNSQPTGSQSGAFIVRGDVASAGKISSTQGFLYTTGTIVAPSCSSGTNAPQSAQGAPGVNCAGPASVSDPYVGTAYDPTSSSIPVDASGNWILGPQSGCSFTPGYYPDVTPLNNCTNAVFAPGTYYFDFHNNGAKCGSVYCDPTYSPQYPNPSTHDQWIINGTVIGGTSPSGGTLTPSATAQIPGACASPIDKTTAQGVQFIFGGDSRMALSSTGNVELCGTYNNGNAPIVIYGLDGSTTARGKLAATYATNNLVNAPNSAPSTVAPSGFIALPAGTLDKDAVALADSKIEKWTTVGGGSASLTLGGLSVGSIPAGSTVTSVSLVLRHQESATAGTITPLLQYSTGSGYSNTTIQPTVKTTLTSEPIDLTSDLALAVASGNLGNVSFKLTENTKNGLTAGSATVDQVQLQVAYEPPLLRGETTTAITNNCVPASAASRCDVFGLSAAGGSFGAGGHNAALVIDGATYLPVGSVNGNVGNGSGTVALRWGLVADTANLNGWPNYSFSYPIVSIPDAGPGLGSNFTAVDMKVYLCDPPSSGTFTGCPTTGTPDLTARVGFTDQISQTTGLITQVPGTRTVNVLSWAPRR